MYKPLFQVPATTTIFILFFVVFLELFAHQIIKRINIITTVLALVAKWVPWKLRKPLAQEID